MANLEELLNTNDANEQASRVESLLRSYDLVLIVQVQKGTGALNVAMSGGQATTEQITDILATAIKLVQAQSAKIKAEKESTNVSPNGITPSSESG